MIRHQVAVQVPGRLPEAWKDITRQITVSRPSGSARVTHLGADEIAALLARCSDRVQRRAEDQDDQELGQGRAAGQAIVLACLAARNRRQPGEDTSGDG